MIAPHREIAFRSAVEARFCIGVVDVSVSGDLPEVIEDFAALYEHERQGDDAPIPSSNLTSADQRAAGFSPRGFAHPDNAHDRIETATTRPDVPLIRMEIRSRREGWLARRAHTVCGDDEKLWTAQRACEVLPYIEWGINYRVISRRPEFLQLHAATLALGDAGLIFAADSGSGKSTLTAGLLAHGWKYLSDEFALIDPTDLMLHPFPKALCIKAGSFDLMRRIGLPVWRNRHYVKALKGPVGYIRPHDIRPDVVSGPVPVRHIIFPQYIAGARPALQPIPRAQAAFLLAGCAFNRNGFDHQATPVINTLVRQAHCYRLEIGQLDETCALLESL